jgi:hypothetical protein
MSSKVSFVVISAVSLTLGVTLACGGSVFNASSRDGGSGTS